MLLLDDIKGYIAGLGAYNIVYIGKMDNKKDHSVGVYPRKASGQPVTALGGSQYSTYDIRHITLLIHWDRMCGPLSRRPMNYLRNLEMHPT